MEKLFALSGRGGGGGSKVCLQGGSPRFFP